MIINKEDLWGCSVTVCKDGIPEGKSICMKCLTDKELESASLNAFFFSESPQFNGTLTPALMFCDRCGSQIKCPWATIDREFDKMHVNDPKLEAMVETLVKNGYGINEIQEFLSKPYSLQLKDDHIEIREEHDIKF